MDEMELVFKALADPHRRLLLDRLHERDGQTLLELQSHLPMMTRFGVMKHLKLLEEAGLIATRKVGREKHHHLNPVPIQQLYDRWVSKYARPWARALTSLKYALEEPPVIATKTQVFTVFIRTTPERLWQALTDGEITRQYYFGTRVESSFEPGAPYTYVGPDGAPVLEGEILEVDPPKRLVTTFSPNWVPSGHQRTTVTYEIEQQGEACKLTVIHEGLEEGSPLFASITQGWPQVLSGLKTYLETGEPLVIGEP